MSTSSIRITAVTVTPDKSKHLGYDEVQIGNQPRITCNADGLFCQQFSPPIELARECQVTLHGKKRWMFGRRKLLCINTQNLFTSAGEHRTQDLSIVQDNIWITFSCEAQPNSSSATHSPPSVEGKPSTDPLVPTTQAILEQCPRFRILVIGKTGVGKSSLIHEAFGISEVHASRLKRGLAKIEDELISPDNKRFVLHDSMGFEPGDQDTYKNVKDFIRSRRDVEIKDQLHAVWFCIATPIAGGRLLEAGAEEFFRTKRETLGNIPMVVVFTKFDQVVNHERYELLKSNPNGLSKEDIERQASLNADACVERCRAKIAEFTSEPGIPYAAVSTKEIYKDTMLGLINQTYQLVGGTDIANAYVASVVTVMAQRIDTHLNIQGSIDIGKQRYWRTLIICSFFTGRTVQNLSVVQKDIVAVWNFYDPNNLLSSQSEFMNDLGRMIQAIMPDKLTVPEKGKHTFAIASSFAGGLAAFWNYDIPDNARDAEQLFIAFVVDLTHILKTLYIQTGGDPKPLTRDVIKRASAHYESNVMERVHDRIRKHRPLTGRDAALDMIESLIIPEQSEQSIPELKSYYVGLKLNQSSK